MIYIENLSLHFNNKTIFQNFDLHINPGEKILLNSSSGGGKTSLLKTLMGFLKYDEGIIKIDNFILNKDNIDKIRNSIIYLDQESSFYDDTVFNLLKTIFSYKNNIDLKDYLDSFYNYCNEFRLEKSIIDKKSSLLSGGERQRFAFIICLMLNKKIWLLDEITASLDKELKNLVQKYILETDSTVIVVSHDNHWDKEKFREVRW